MKNYLFLVVMILIVLIGSKNCFSQVIPDGSYFGQNPPGSIPEIFAPGIISLEDRYEYVLAFSPDLNECVFGITNSNWSYFTLMYTKMVDDSSWTEPNNAPFQGNGDGLLPSYSPDGTQIYFVSSRPSWPPANIWRSERNDTSWNTPDKMPSPINSGSDEFGVSLSNDETLYFISQRSGGYGQGDIYYSMLENGQYSSVINIGTAINSSNNEASPFIAPDGSYLIFESDRSGGHGQVDLYISYFEDSIWTEPKNLGAEINTGQIDDAAFISPDGKYLFFNRREGWVTNVATDIYWVDSKIVFKPYIVIPIEDTSSIINENFQFEIPSGTFNDYDDDTLSYSASLFDGNPLPLWLTFNAATLAFSGMPTQIDTFNIKLTATDSIGSGTSDEFLVCIKDTTTSVITENITIREFKLSQNYPNPFNTITNISYSLPFSSFVTLKVYDTLGREVHTLINTYRKAGRYSVNFNASELPGGIYFYKLQVSDDFIETNKMLLMK